MFIHQCKQDGRSLSLCLKVAMKKGKNTGLRKVFDNNLSVSGSSTAPVPHFGTSSPQSASLGDQTTKRTNTTDNNPFKSNPKTKHL